MKIILIKNVEKLGSAGEVVKVKDGYARNFLLPKNLAVDARRKNAKFLDNEKKKLEAKGKRLKGEAESLKEKLNNISCTIAMPTGEEDKLYGEVTPELVANFYKQEGIDIDKRRVHLESPIRHLGVYQVDIKLHPDVVANVKVWVVKK